MPQSQRDVRNRIGAVKNIQKITRAMEMVAAARLRRAEQRIEALRPYANAIRRMTRQAAESFTGFTDRPAYADARRIAERLMAAYVDGEVDQVEIFYNGYISPVSQVVRRETLLPLQQATVLEEESDDEDQDGDRDRDGGSPEHRALVEYEPDPEEILKRLVPDYVEISI